MPHHTITIMADIIQAVIGETDTIIIKGADWQADIIFAMDTATIKINDTKPEKANTGIAETIIKITEEDRYFKMQANYACIIIV